MCSISIRLEFQRKVFVAIATRLEFSEEGFIANATRLDFLRKVSLQLLLVLSF